MFNSTTAEEIQNDIYRRMSADKKMRIAGQLFLLGRKLDLLKKQNAGHSRRATRKNSKNS